MFEKMRRPLSAPFLVQSRRGVITAAQWNAIFTTPQIIVPAPKTGWFNVFHSMVLHKQAGTAYVGANNAIITYTNGAGVEVAEIPMAGFHDQTTVQTRHVWNSTGAIGAATALTPAAAAALVLSVLTANPTTGTGNFLYRVWFSVVPMVP